MFDDPWPKKMDGRDEPFEGFQGRPWKFPTAPWMPGHAKRVWMPPTSTGDIQSRPRWNDKPSGLTWRKVGPGTPEGNRQNITHDAMRGNKCHQQLFYAISNKCVDAFPAKLTQEEQNALDAACTQHSHMCNQYLGSITKDQFVQGQDKTSCFFVPETGNRLKCGCLLFSRIKIVTGAQRTTPATSGRVHHLEAGDRIEMHFWLLVGRNRQNQCDTNPQAHDTCVHGQGGSTEAHTVRLDNTSDEEEPKLLFSSAPWIKFTLVAVKPDGDNDVDHVPLSPCQLPGTFLQHA